MATAAPNQIFITLLDGTTRCLQLASPTVSPAALHRRLSSLTGIPADSLRLVTGRRTVSSSLAAADGFFPSCTLLLRLRGGKGGFGSLLRGAATKAGQKKTNNFDACRDMSGRRLRHVNAEKKLEEWRAEAEDRRLEKSAEVFLKKKAKEVKRNSPVDVGKYLDKYRADSAKCMEEVDESVKQSFQLHERNKRKFVPGSQPSKRMKIWLGKGKVDESESESEDEEDNDEEGSGSGDGDEKSVVLNGGNGESSSGFGTQSDGESSGGGSEKSNLEEVNVEVEEELDEAGVECLGGARMEVVEELHEESAEEERSFGPELPSIVEEVKDTDRVELMEGKEVEAELVVKESVVQTSEPLNFDLYNSAADLEVLGLERLKLELQSHGLKCGGTLQERAARLFMLKTTPVEKLPKKLLAKPAGGGK